MGELLVELLRVPRGVSECVGWMGWDGIGWDGIGIFVIVPRWLKGTCKVRYL